MFIPSFNAISYCIQNPGSAPILIIHYYYSIPHQKQIKLNQNRHTKINPQNNQPKTLSHHCINPLGNNVPVCKDEHSEDAKHQRHIGMLSHSAGMRQGRLRCTLHYIWKGMSKTARAASSSTPVAKGRPGVKLWQLLNEVPWW